METNWAVEAGEDDPLIIVPWSDPSGRLGYVDLENGATVEAIPETLEWPELLTILRVLNQNTSQVWTTKCDAWVLAAEELELDFGPVAYGFGAYCDVLPKSRARFSSASSLQWLVQSWAERAGRSGPVEARADFVMRHALWHGIQGYGVTLYFFGYGETVAAARKNWATVAEQVADLVAATGDTMTMRASSSIG